MSKRGKQKIVTLEIICVADHNDTLVLTLMKQSFEEVPFEKRRSALNIST